MQTRGNRFIGLLLGLCLLLSCGKEAGDQPGETALVVEGWIENGSHPVVLVSESISLVTGELVSAQDMLSYIAKWARVTVSDGEKTVVLTGMTDTGYFPPYIFTSSEITGEVGKTYSLSVTYKDYEAQAFTTIPAPFPVDTVYVKQMASDSLATLVVGFTDPPAPGHFYRIFTRTEGVDSHYHPSALANVSDEFMHDYAEMNLYSTQRLMDYIDYPNIHEGDRIWIKLCTQGEDSFNYWNAFEASIMDNVGNMRNVRESGISRNMQGAVGYWAGYGVAREVCFQVSGEAAGD